MESISSSSSSSPMKRPRKSSKGHGSLHNFNSTAPMSLSRDSSFIEQPPLVFSSSADNLLLGMHETDKDDHLEEDSFPFFSEIMEEFSLPAGVSQSQALWTETGEHPAIIERCSGDGLIPHTPSITTTPKHSSSHSHELRTDRPKNDYTNGDELQDWNVQEVDEFWDSSVPSTDTTTGVERYSNIIHSMNFNKLWDITAPKTPTPSRREKSTQKTKPSSQAREFVCETLPSKDSTNVQNSKHPDVSRGDTPISSRILRELQKHKTERAESGDSDDMRKFEHTSNFSCSSVISVGSVISKQMARNQHKRAEASKDFEPCISLCHPLLSESGLCMFGTNQPLISNERRIRETTITGQKRRAKSLLHAFQRKLSVNSASDSVSKKQATGVADDTATIRKQIIGPEFESSDSTILLGKLQGTVGDDLALEASAAIHIGSYVRDLRWVEKDALAIYAADSLGLLKVDGELNYTKVCLRKTNRSSSKRQMAGSGMGITIGKPRESAAPRGNIEGYTRQIAINSLHSQVAEAANKKGMQLFKFRPDSDMLVQECQTADSALTEAGTCGSVAWHFSDPMLASWTTDQGTFSILDLRSAQVVNSYKSTRTVVSTSQTHSIRSDMKDSRNTAKQLDVTSRLHDLATVTTELESSNIGTAHYPTARRSEKFMSGLYSHMYLTDFVVMLGFGDGNIQTIDIRKMRPIMSHIDPVVSAIGDMQLSPSHQRLALFGIQGTSFWETGTLGVPICRGFDYLLPRVKQCYPSFAFETSGSFVTDDLVGTVDSTGNLALYDMNSLPSLEPF